jgi:hypothetical protein
MTGRRLFVPVRVLIASDSSVLVLSARSSLACSRDRFKVLAGDAV